MTTIAYQVQRYTPHYKKDVLAVWEKSVLATHHFLSDDDFIEIKNMLNCFDFETLDTFCLTEKDKVIGFIALYQQKVEMLFLDPAYIGKKLGYKLMSFAISEHHVNMVDVNEQNLSAARFYENFGFKTYERTEQDDLGKNYPLLRMRLEN